MSTITQIATDIVNADLTQENIDQLWELLREKSKDLKAKATMLARVSLKVGSEVFTADLRPKALNGLIGKVVKVSKTRADIQLDKELDSWHPAKKYTRGRMLNGVPLTCLKENRLRAKS